MILTHKKIYTVEENMIDTPKIRNSFYRSSNFAIASLLRFLFRFCKFIDSWLLLCIALRIVILKTKVGKVGKL